MADARVGVAGVAVASAVAHWMGVEWGISGGFDVAANIVGKRAAVLVTVPVLLVAISHWIAVAILPAAVSVAGDLGSGSRSAGFEAEDGPGLDTGVGGDDFDDSGAGCQRASMVGGPEDRSELDSRFAGVVSGGEREKLWRSRRAKLNKTI